MMSTYHGMNYTCSTRHEMRSCGTGTLGSTSLLGACHEFHRHLPYVHPQRERSRHLVKRKHRSSTQLCFNKLTFNIVVKMIGGKT